jgi:cell division septum initiation protein DivIVA
MHSPEEQIQQVHQKLQLLLKQYHALQRENRQLKDAMGALETKAAQDAQLIETLKQQTEMLKVSGGVMDETAKKNFEKRINQYIKEIDRCIALLSE